MCIGITDDGTKGQLLSTYPNETDHTLVGFVSANGEELQGQPQTRLWVCVEDYLTVLQDLAGIRLMKRVRASKLQVFW